MSTLPEGTTHEDALAALLRWLERSFQDHRLVAAGHRVVHGGSFYIAPVRIDESVLAELRRLIPLAPLHQPHNLAAIAAVSKLHPALPQIACFDTAYHHTELKSPPPSRCRVGLRKRGSGGMGFMGFPMNTLLASFRTSLVRQKPMVV